MKKYVKYTAILLPAAVMIVFMVLWLTGALGIWTIGIPYIAGSANVFTDESSHPVPGEYSVTIDLKDYDGYDPNKGKELYNDGENVIYVSMALKSSYLPGEGINRIVFHSIGSYSLDGASLVSGGRYAATEDGTVALTQMTMKMTAEYDGKVYDCVPADSVNSEWCTLVKDGNYPRVKDNFGFTFWIFSPEVLEGKEWWEWQPEGPVKLTVTGLYKNIWTRK